MIAIISLGTYFLRLLGNIRFMFKIIDIVSYLFIILHLEARFDGICKLCCNGIQKKAKNIVEVENKSQRLRNERKITESHEFQDHALFLKQELGRYFQQYRELLVRHGMIPIYRVGVPALTEKELQIADDYNSKL